VHMHVCVLAADWWQGGSCICMCVCVFWKLIGEKVAHAYACVCVVAVDW